jgi:uncharacterized lipoprotein
MMGKGELVMPTEVAHAMPIFRSRVVVLVASICAVSALSGCGKRLQTCKQDNKDYVGAQETPPLKAPPGLEAPNTRNSLKIPPLNSPERVRGRDEPCLDAPPPFSTPKATPAAPAAAPAPSAPNPQ